MKFGKTLLSIKEDNDPEWGPFWINYKALKQKIHACVGKEDIDPSKAVAPVLKSMNEIMKSRPEVDFFKLLKIELQKTIDFFTATQQMCVIRCERLWNSFHMLRENVGQIDSKMARERLLFSCFEFLRSLHILIEYGSINCTGFDKILKKHDKHTGYVTRTAFMKKEVLGQNFATFAEMIKLIGQTEQLIIDVQSNMNTHQRSNSLSAEQQLFVDALLGLHSPSTSLESTPPVFIEEIGTDCQFLDQIEIQTIHRVTMWPRRDRKRRKENADSDNEETSVQNVKRMSAVSGNGSGSASAGGSSGGAGSPSSVSPTTFRSNNTDNYRSKYSDSSPKTSTVSTVAAQQQQQQWQLVSSLRPSRIDFLSSSDCSDSPPTATTAAAATTTENDKAKTISGTSGHITHERMNSGNNSSIALIGDGSSGDNLSSGDVDNALLAAAISRLDAATAKLDAASSRLDSAAAVLINAAMRINSLQQSRDNGGSSGSSGNTSSYIDSLIASSYGDPYRAAGSDNHHNRHYQYGGSAIGITSLNTNSVSGGGTSVNNRQQANFNSAESTATVNSTASTDTNSYNIFNSTVSTGIPIYSKSIPVPNCSDYSIPVIATAGYANYYSGGGGGGGGGLNGQGPSIGVPMMYGDPHTNSTYSYYAPQNSPVPIAPFSYFPPGDSRDSTSNSIYTSQMPNK